LLKPVDFEPNDMTSHLITT